MCAREGTLHAQRTPIGIRDAANPVYGTPPHAKEIVLSDTPAQTPANPAPANSGQPGENQSQTTNGASNQQSHNSPPANPQGNPNPQHTNPDLDRLSNQVKGMSRIVNPLTENGYNTPESINELIRKAKAHDDLGKTGFRADQYVQSHRQVSERQNNGDEPMTMRQFQEFQARDRATVEHTQSVGAMRSGIDSIATKLVGQGNEHHVRSEIAQAMQPMLKRYPQGHPLEGNTMPLTRDELAQLETKAQELYDEKVGFLMSRGQNAPMSQQASLNPTNPTQGGGQNEQKLSGRELMNQRQAQAKMKTSELVQANMQQRGV